MKPGFFRLPRRTLFLKICLWFWVTSAVVGVSMVAFDRFAGFFPLHKMMERELGTVLWMYGSLALDRFEAGDPKEIERMEARLREETGITAWLLDPSGTPVGGASPPKEARKIAEQVLRQGKTAFGASGSKAIAALPLSADDGRRYVALGEVSRFRPMRPPGPRPGIFADDHPPEMHPDGPPPGPRSMWPARLAIFLLISGLVCALLARHLTAPLVQLRNATRRLAGGDLSARMGKRTWRWGDELSDLSADFDAMAERIETLLTMQRQLLGDISHELRSPLARLNVALELARRQKGKDAEKALDRIGVEARALNDMIDQVLTLTRLESGIEVLPGAPVELTHLVRDIAGNADFEAKGSGRNVELVERTDSSIVSGNAELLQRAIENVVRNAIRYERDRGTVEIRIRNVPPD
ncbi:MAG: HAMP domain-containing protein, partial [Deltaproteobacteria bacterium]|nr:HAMP domain-containing protein [Deltaproteobacteria bacterium]